MPFTLVDPVPRWRRRLSAWRALPLPRRCVECHRWNRGMVEAISGIRFDICDTCVDRGWFISEWPNDV